VFIEIRLQQIGFVPSFPYLNCTILFDPSLIVPSYAASMLSLDFMIRLEIYPERLVSVAVASNPTRPLIACIKNSCGFNPSRNECLINPLCAALESCLLKCGNVLSLNRFGTR